MRYDFDEIVDRRGTGSLKWDVPEGELPMWVADMDFKAAPEIREAFEARIRQGVFGYNIIPDEWAEAYQGWWQRRHGLAIDKDWLIFVTGVVPAISSSVRKLTTPNENVLIQTPVYNIFFNSIINNGCRVLESPLTYEDGAYGIDWQDLEAKLADPQTSLMILCNPHNPVGKIWDRETLARIGQLCDRHHVTVLSDEIHCDITTPGTSYVPFASVDETCRRISVTLIAPTKCFNLAGLQTAAVMIPDPFLRHKVWRALNTDELAEPNSFAITAAVTAFNKGEAWLEEMRAYVEENKTVIKAFLEKELPMIHLVHGEATYLCWLDCSELLSLRKKTGAESAPDERPLGDQLEHFLREEAKVYLTSGAEYGQTGENFLRLNAATPRANILEGLARFKKGIEAFLA